MSFKQELQDALASIPSEGGVAKVETGQPVDQVVMGIYDEFYFQCRASGIGCSIDQGKGVVTISKPIKCAPEPTPVPTPEPVVENKPEDPQPEKESRFTDRFVKWDLKKGE